LGDALRREGVKGVLIAAVSTVLVLTVAILLVVNSPGWPSIKQAFFSGSEFADTFPGIAEKFLRNIQYFLVAEAFILVWALVVAVLRGLPGPVFFPIRLFAIGYTDFFRGIPTIIVIYLLAFGIPSLDLRGLPNSPTLWGIVGLILSYSAYVAEVYRAGIESVHPSQTAAARSLGLSRWQSLRYVVIPQAVRRVVPPLLNDFIGLQKDTALLAVVVVAPEAFRQAQIDAAGDFNYTPIVSTALLFLLVTIPLTRFVDWLLARQRAQREGSGIL
jgi:polar amino acid transport system permease protein